MEHHLQKCEKSLIIRLMDDEELDIKQTIDLGNTLTILISFVIGLMGWVLFLGGFVYAVRAGNLFVDDLYWPMTAGGLLICAARIARTVARLDGQVKDNTISLDQSFEAIGFLLQENNVALQKTVLKDELVKMAKKTSKRRR